MNPRRARALLKTLVRMETERRARLLAALPPPAFRALAEEWWWQAHGGQREPDGPPSGSGRCDWRVWMLVAGRGFGKTRTGAEWVSARARETPGARIALIGGSLAEVASVMVEGPSGLLAVARTGERLRWRQSRGVVDFPSGAKAFCYSGARPAMLRGPEHDFAWADELAKWDRPEETWDILQLGLRRGARPRTLITTTPRGTGAAAPLLKRIAALEGTVRTGGRTAENRHLAAAFRQEMEAIYGGTRLGRQELNGELLGDVEGALWTRAMIEQARQSPPLEGMKRIVVGVDPPASADGDECGIVVCGLGCDGSGYVLADCSVAGLRPEGWARAVARAADAWGADRVIAEKNQGGDMVESVLKGVEAALPVRLVSATGPKAARAEPIAGRFEAGKAKLAGRFPALEDQLAGMTAGRGYQGPGRSPDRADAMVWAMAELLLRPAAAEPRIRLV